MAPQPISPEKLKQAVGALQAALDAGYRYKGIPSAWQRAAAALGIDNGTLRHRVNAAFRAGHTVNIPEEPEAPVPEIEQIVKPRVRVQAHSTSDAPIYRVLGIGDIHIKPGREFEHLRWAGRHAAATKPDRIIQIGDALSLDSCSFHAARGSHSDFDRPSFSRDIEAGEEALEAFDRECPGDQIPRTTVHGNHEDRAWRRAEVEPKLADDFPLRVTQLFARYRWETVPFGRMYYYGSVGWVHIPLNQLGRPYGGKNSENQIGNDATHSIVWGHDHRFRTKTVPKIGPNNRITLVNLGTCMPQGVIEDYNVGTTGWTYGVVDLRIQGGLIVSAKFIDVRELSEMYGD